MCKQHTIHLRTQVVSAVHSTASVLCFSSSPRAHVQNSPAITRRILDRLCPACVCFSTSTIIYFWVNTRCTHTHTHICCTCIRAASLRCAAYTAKNTLIKCTRGICDTSRRESRRRFVHTRERRYNNSLCATAARPLRRVTFARTLKSCVSCYKNKEKNNIHKASETLRRRKCATRKKSCLAVEDVCCCSASPNAAQSIKCECGLAAPES